MPINNITTVTKFLGASVTSIQSSAGFEEQASRLQITLVEVPEDGDSFFPPDTGTPVSFKFQGYQFDGLMQKYTTNRSPSGDPVYEVTIYSPTDILECVQLVLSSFVGVNLTCPNLLNVFGYLEDGGNAFGGSQRNESGIPWYLVKQAIQDLQTGQTPFSTGILYKGHNYYIDFGSMPTVPDFYRLGGGVSISLNQAIHTVFEDSAYDFIVQLEKMPGTGPHRIYFKSRSRARSTPYGQIEEFVNGRTNIVSYEAGNENRSDITCGVLLGGDQEIIIPLTDPGDQSVIAPFWGFQQDPNLVPFTLEGNRPIVESTGTGDDEEVLLNSTSILDLVGSPTYSCSVFEMRLALIDYDPWAVYIARNKPEIAQTFGFEVFPSIFGNEVFEFNPQSFYANNLSAVTAFSDTWIENAAMENLKRFYNFVRSSAETYLGKQFMVRIPFYLQYYFEEETNKLQFSMNVNSDGYWPDYLGGFNSGPLGLAYQNFNNFMNETGKFTPFLKYTAASLLNADLGSRNSDDIVIQGDDVYVRCNQDQNILFTPAPAVLCVINEPIWERVADPVGGIDDVALLCDVDPQSLVETLQMENGEFPVRIHPRAVMPVGAAICLKSNEYTYGPWTNIGVPGKVKVEQNTGLVPWNYGGFATMSLAAQDQLADIGSTNQNEETGSVTFTGAPDISLGDQLNGSGPIVTSIDVSIDNQGITTTYRMQSQTPVFGVFSKQNAERLRRLGTAAQDLRRTLRGYADRLRESNRISAAANWISSFQQFSRAVDRENSTNVIQAFIPEENANGEVFPQISAQTFSRALGSSNAHDSTKFQRTASMGMEGIFRPFSTDVNASGVPHFEKNTGNGVGQIQLNPFQQGNDMLWAANGNQFNGYYARGANFDGTKMRGVGLRGPAVMVGWGKELTGKPVPNLNPSGDALLQNMDDTQYLDKYLTKSNQWKVGPVDLRWDKWNKVWSFPGILFGTMTSSSGVKIDTTNDIVDIEPYFNFTYSNGLRVAIAYFAITDTWRVLSANCNN